MLYDFDDQIEKDYAFVDDPIALSCAAYRQYQLTKLNRWPGLNDMVVEPQDRSQADAVRKYYADRLILDVLRQQQSVSSFRHKLYGLVTGVVKLKRSELGILYRLPDFYAEDTGLDKLVQDTASADHVNQGAKITAEFVLRQCITKSRRSGEFVQFWLARTGDTAAYAVMLKKDNPMLSLLNSVLSRPVTLSACVCTKQFRGYHQAHRYYELTNLKLA